MRCRRLQFLFFFVLHIFGLRSNGLSCFQLLGLYALPDLVSFKEIFVNAQVGTNTGFLAFLTVCASLSMLQ